MKKNYLFVMALAAMVSCSSDEFVGDSGSPNVVNGNGNEKAIAFNSSAAKITRATSNTGTVSQMLDGQFLVYGTKNVSGTYSSVFPNYVAWNKNDLTATTSNPDGNNAANGWEYVGPSTTTYGSGSATLSKEQTIKYWDYSAANYHFVAGSPVASFTYTITSNDIVSATVTGLAGHISANTGTGITTNPVYIAKPVNVESTDYNKPVKFEFVRQQARVRVGIYETIPGYKITEIKFYSYGNEAWNSSDPSNNIILASPTADYFVGGKNDEVKGTITYTWTGDGAPKYSFSYEDANTSNDKKLTKAKNWYGGAFNYAVDDPAPAWEMATTASAQSDIKKFFGKDGDIDASSGYFTVLPTQVSTASPILIKCDYTLSSEVDGSGETINVSGATAAIPAAFSFWKPNTSYTYIFKISDNTNGSTGNGVVGLYPITFDAVAVADGSGVEQGTITTVSTPSITTYQTGSVVDQTTPSEVHGIKYVTGKAIYVTVANNEDGTLLELTDGGSSVGAVQVYKLAEAKTEADFQISAPTGIDLFELGTSETTVTVTIGSDTYNTVTLPANKFGTFTPSDAGYYVIKYLTTAASGSDPAVYTYKVVYVESAS